METLLLAIIPLFVSIDPIGAIPMFLGLTHGFSVAEKRRLAVQAVVTGFIVGLAFCVAGHYVFSFLGITSADFKIAGGILLLVFSVREIFGESVKLAPGPNRDMMTGIVPLGIPLIAGPAMITTILILHDLYRIGVVSLALLFNMAVTWLLFVYADKISSKTGPVFGRVVAKVMAIFLAAIGVMMIRRGIEAIFVR
jgi:multiple antibiotic resistance protein